MVAREGGIHSLLLLLARAVELGCDDSDIALALDITFRCVLKKKQCTARSWLLHLQHLTQCKNCCYYSTKLTALGLLSTLVSTDVRSYICLKLYCSWCT